MEYYKPEAQQPEKKDRTLINLVLAGCGCLVLIGALFAVFAGKFFNVVRGPQKIVQAHLQALNQGNPEEAYLFFSNQFRKKTSLEEFRAEIETHANVFPYNEVSLNKIEVKNNDAVVEGTIIGSDGAIVPVSYNLRRESGEWVILNYSWIAPGERRTI